MFIFKKNIYNIYKKNIKIFIILDEYYRLIHYTVLHILCYMFLSINYKHNMI